MHGPERRHQPPRRRRRGHGRRRRAAQSSCFGISRDASTSWPRPARQRGRGGRRDDRQRVPGARPSRRSCCSRPSRSTRPPSARSTTHRRAPERGAGAASVEQLVRGQGQELGELVRQRDLLEDPPRLVGPALLPHLVADLGVDPRVSSSSTSSTCSRVTRASPWRIHCQICEREISAVAASSMRLLIPAAPRPPSQNEMYWKPTLTSLRRPGLGDRAGGRAPRRAGRRR